MNGSKRMLLGKVNAVTSLLAIGNLFFLNGNYIYLMQSTHQSNDEILKAETKMFNIFFSPQNAKV